MAEGGGWEGVTLVGVVEEVVGGKGAMLGMGAEAGAVMLGGGSFWPPPKELRSMVWGCPLALAELLPCVAGLLLGVTLASRSWGSWGGLTAVTADSWPGRSLTFMVTLRGAAAKEWGSGLGATTFRGGGAGTLTFWNTTKIYE